MDAQRRPRSSRVRRTLDRVGVLVPDERTLVVGLRRHRRALCTGLAPHSPGLLLQPRDRGSAPAILLAAQCIAHLDSTATVATFPADHDVAEDRQLMIHVADAADYVALYPERIVLLAVEATEADTQYGWISPGWPLARIGATTISGVGCFVDEPAPADAQAYLETGALWNTFVMVARAATLADIGRQHVPLVHERLAAAVPFIGTDWEPAVLRSTYATLPPASFSCAVLERAAPRLAVSRVA
ncbi:MAG TPA: sugar phosphate nucleotidyltransferase [Candidatus Limnocylindria bacterium]|nr:sugar phosphate nucleotidyltransferase [Candidatus Limnocylindria bacterium]